MPNKMDAPEPKDNKETPAPKAKKKKKPKPEPITKQREGTYIGGEDDSNRVDEVKKSIAHDDKRKDSFLNCVHRPYDD